MSEAVQSQFEIKVTVGAEFVDGLGHVNNAAYLMFTESAARAHADSVGVTQQEMSDRQGAFVVRRHEATYYGEAKLGDELLVKTWAHSFSGPRCVRDVEVYLGERRIFHCKTDWVWIDLARRSPKRLPQDIQERFTTVDRQ